MFIFSAVKTPIKSTVTYFLLLFAFFSCTKDNAFDCFKSNGRIISDIRPLGEFSAIEVTTKIDINIFKGPDYKVEVLAGEHIIKNITTKVVDGTLKIDNVNRCNFVRGYKKTVTLNITVPSIAFIKNDGVGTITFANDYAQDTLVIRTESSGDIYINGVYKQIRTSAHGNGDVYINGSSNSLYVYTNGTNYLYAQQLRVKDYIFIETLSIGDCFVNADSLQMDYKIWQSGNIYYTGAPRILNDFSVDHGSGQAIRQ